jgi:hypothetical protein
LRAALRPTPSPEWTHIATSSATRLFVILALFYVVSNGLDFGMPHDLAVAPTQRATPPPHHQYWAWPCDSLRPTDVDLCDRSRGFPSV